MIDEKESGYLHHKPGYLGLWKCICGRWNDVHDTKCRWCWRVRGSKQ